jgi:hypothetical protein
MLGVKERLFKFIKNNGVRTPSTKTLVLGQLVFCAFLLEVLLNAIKSMTYKI